MFVNLIKHTYGLVLFEQAIATSTLQSYVTHVSTRCYTYIACEYECKMMLMLMIRNA
jgi:hypothetical protein